MVALSIILFTGGMDTKLQEVRPVMVQGILLSTVGVLLTTLLTGTFIFYISEWNSTNIELTFMFSLLYHVVDRLGFCIQSAPFPANELKGKSPSYAGTGKRK